MPPVHRFRSSDEEKYPCSLKKRYKVTARPSLHVRILAKTRDRKQSGYTRRGSPRAASDGVTIAAPSAARRDNRWSRTRSSTSLKEIQRWWEAFLPVIQEKRDSEHLEFDIWYQWIRHVNSTSGGAAERRNELRVCNRVLTARSSRCKPLGHSSPACLGYVPTRHAHRRSGQQRHVLLLIGSLKR
ncbi:hypothetical protein C0Q70_05284 [Pomacea canaliculata]|uniref:Uncharacterized protein n=1 Tax=Pomacea canaliculata TaxID=400727 RepID=A0A2T7PKU8_POMCA|nr:hypothetical protein C0Q70_05284 [Pomacea canaliculata]